MIEVENISVLIHDQTLLSEVTFQASEGEHIAIVGPNGAGKTTLLRCLLGLLKPNNGSVQIHNQNISTLKRTTMAQKIAYVPQQLGSEIPFTVQEFVAMSRYSHLGGDDVAMTMMERVGIADMANRSVSTLSGGERQKVSIAAALTQQTPILILDEPAAHLDPKQQDSVQQVLGEIGKDKTIITVTHDLNWAAQDFDRIIGMRSGKIICDATPAEFMTTENLESIFDVTWELYPHPQNGTPIVIR